MPEKINTVSEYLNALPVPARKSLQHVRKAIKTAAPKAEEKISYRIPVYRFNGDLIAFAAFKNHCSLITMSTGVINKFKSELGNYKISGTTVQFPHDKPLSEELIKKIVKKRLEENGEKTRGK